MGTLAGVAAAVMLAWNTWAVYPLKILVVFFHEFSHALASWITGGHVVEIQLNAAQGGLCKTAGGIRFVVLTAGYLGSLLTGGVILCVAVRTRLDRAASAGLGLLLLGVAIGFVRPLFHFGFAFGVLAGLALLTSARWLPARANELLLEVIGLTSCLYAVMDIKSDILDRPQAESDAVMLAELTGLSPLFWGVVWMLIALYVSWHILRVVCVKQADCSLPSRSWAER